MNPRGLSTTDLAGIPNIGNTAQCTNIEKTLLDFKTFCMVDRQLTEETAKTHRAKVRRFLEWCTINSVQINQSTIRAYLSQFNGGNCYTYANALKSLKVFCRDFLKQPDYVESFKFPNVPFKPKNIPSKQAIQQFYQALDNPKDQSLFLFYASSALRRQEALSLNIEDIEFEKRMVNPKPHSGKTKHTWITFFNEECEKSLKFYLSERKDCNPKLFPMSRLTEENLWHDASVNAGFKITPQQLREWFCNEMGLLGVQDRYIDAFCGRLPKSVLARHYSDYSPQRLMEIYGKAQLKIL